MSQAGFVLVFFCFAITSLMGVAALAVDVGNWYLHVQEEQRAADSAALAGAVHLPLDANTAIAEAKSVVSNNGLQSNDPNITVTAYQVPGQPNWMYVSVKQTVHNIFLSMLGVNNSTFTRQATAEYRPAMVFGSPSNVLGEEPAGKDLSSAPATWLNSAFAGKQGNYFMQISAPGSLKANGAEWTSGNCGPRQNLNTGNLASTSNAAGCDTTQQIPYQNIEFDPNGDTIQLHVPAGVSGTMAVDLFDPTFVDTETNCVATWLKNVPASGSPNLYAWDPTGANGGTVDAAALAYCSGDREELGGTIPKAFNTRYWLTTPDSDGNKPVAGCDQTYGGWEPQYNAITDITAPTAAQKADPKSIYNTFHKWARMCNLTVGGVNPTGDYVLHVNVPTPQNGGVPVGTNDYSLRIAMMNSVGTPSESINSQTNQLSIRGGGNRLEATSVSRSAPSIYYVGQIVPGLQGQTVKVRWSDLGDNAVTLTILPPRDATVNGAQLTSWSGCTQAGYGGPNNTQLATPAPGPIAGCSYSIPVHAYDGTIVEISIPVPAGYNCGTDGQPDDCWFRAQQTYPGNGLGVDDYWSMSANYDEPVLHIIK